MPTKLVLGEAPEAGADDDNDDDASAATHARQTMSWHWNDLTDAITNASICAELEQEWMRFMEELTVTSTAKRVANGSNRAACLHHAPTQTEKRTEMNAWGQVTLKLIDILYQALLVGSIGMIVTTRVLADCASRKARSVAGVLNKDLHATEGLESFINAATSKKRSGRQAGFLEATTKRKVPRKNALHQ